MTPERGIPKLIPKRKSARVFFSGMLLLSLPVAPVLLGCTEREIENSEVAIQVVDADGLSGEDVEPGFEEVSPVACAESVRTVDFLAWMTSTVAALPDMNSDAYLPPTPAFSTLSLWDESRRPEVSSLSETTSNGAAKWSWKPPMYRPVGRHGLCARGLCRPGHCRNPPLRQYRLRAGRWPDSSVQ